MGNTSPEAEDPVNVTFALNYTTKPGEVICLAGDIPELGNWKNFKPGMMKSTEEKDKAG